MEKFWRSLGEAKKLLMRIFRKNGEIFFILRKRQKKKSRRFCFATEDQSNAPVEVQFFLNMADNFKLLLLPVLDMLFEDDEDERCGTEDEMITLFGPLLLKHCKTFFLYLIMGK